MDTLCRNIDPSLSWVTTLDYSHGGPSRYTSVGDGGGECGSNVDGGAVLDPLSLGFFFDIDAKSVIIKETKRGCVRSVSPSFVVSHSTSKIIDIKDR